MNALVTGGQGFVGSHLCELLLSRGHAVRVLARATSDLGHIAGLDLEVVRGDVTDPASLPDAVRGIDVVFHVAGALKGFVEQDLARVNTEGTLNLARAAAAAGSVARFVFVSSLAAAGPSLGGRVPRTEDMPEAPLTWYGTSKLAGERALRDVPGLRSVIVRPPIVFGPRERDLLGYFRIAKRGLLPVLGPGERHYSLVFAPDLVQALLGAATADVPTGSVYFAAGPEVVSWSELGGMIATALGVRARAVPLPRFAAVLAGHGADVVARLRGRPEIFSSQKVIEMCAPAWVASPERAARDLGWRAATPLADALAITARWYRDHGWI